MAMEEIADGSFVVGDGFDVDESASEGEQVHGVRISGYRVIGQSGNCVIGSLAAAPSHSLGRAALSCTGFPGLTLPRLRSGQALGYRDAAPSGLGHAISFTGRRDRVESHKR